MTHTLRLVPLLLLLVGAFTGWAQTSLSTDTYFQVSSENDGYQLRSRDVTDRYYTNGLRVEWMSNYWHRWPTRHLLLSFPASPISAVDELYSFSVGQEMYTPRRTDRVNPPLYPYDRPYAGYLYLAWKLTAADAERNRRLTSTFTLGVLGPVSLADRTQTQLHKLLHQPAPAGWANQIRTDPAISYSVRLENRPIGYLSPNFDLISVAEATVGTLGNYAGLGCYLRLGLFNDYFSSVTGFYKRGRAGAGRRFQLYGFIQPTYRSVLDNALLQGGWINGRRNEYALPANELEHFYGQADYGLVLAYKGFRLSLAESIRGKEYRTGEQQQWGRFDLSWRISR